jgi:hypothetical protein
MITALSPTPTFRETDERDGYTLLFFTPHTAPNKILRKIFFLLDLAANGNFTNHRKVVAAKKSVVKDSTPVALSLLTREPVSGLC